MSVSGPTGEDDVLAPLRASPGDSALFVDFDGTLSLIVDDPLAARPLDGVADALHRLSDVLGLVAVLSGRPVDFLTQWLPPEVDVFGLYGIESRTGGQRVDHAQAGAWREVVRDVANVSAGRGPAGMRVESKGLSLTLHYRTRPDLADAVQGWARAQAARSGLVVRAAKMSVELHPPIAVDKGTTVMALCRAAESRTACYFGDDVGDLPAYDALDRLADEGVRTVRVAVTSTEVPAALVDRADITVDGPPGALALLESMLD